MAINWQISSSKRIYHENNTSADQLNVLRKQKLHDCKEQGSRIRLFFIRIYQKIACDFEFLDSY